MDFHFGKRKFLLTTAGATLGLLVSGLGAWGQGVTLKLRALTNSGKQATGLQKRLERFRIAKAGDAFKLANRKAEIEVTQ